MKYVHLIYNTILSFTDLPPSSIVRADVRVYIHIHISLGMTNAHGAVAMESTILVSPTFLWQIRIVKDQWRNESIFILGFLHFGK